MDCPTKLSCSPSFLEQPLRYDYRQEWMRFSMLLFAHDDYRQISRRVIKALADLLGSPQGVLFEWEEEKQSYVLKDCWNHNFPNKEMILEPCAFTDYLENTQSALELSSDFLHNVGKNLATPHMLAHFAWAWLLVPLMHGERLYAFVILAHPQGPPFHVDKEVLDLLAMAGRQSVICLVQERNAQALAIARQFEGYNRLSAFVMHDLKNVLAQLRLIQSNREKHEHNPIFVKSVYQTVEHTAEKIDRLLVQMRSRQQHMTLQGVEVAKSLQKVIQLTDHRQPIPRLDWQVPFKEIKVIGEEDRFINVLCHLVENAQQATPENGEVILFVCLKKEKLLIDIQDTGCGMECEFIHTGLYKPFVTTKREKGTGIGVYEAREYMYALGGKLTVESVKEKGSTFTLELPLMLPLENL